MAGLFGTLGIATGLGRTKKSSPAMRGPSLFDHIVTMAISGLVGVRRKSAGGVDITIACTNPRGETIFARAVAYGKVAEYIEHNAKGRIATLTGTVNDNILVVRTCRLAKA